jgi:hypothetical protein
MSGNNFFQLNVSGTNSALLFIILSFKTKVECDFSNFIVYGNYAYNLVKGSSLFRMEDVCFHRYYSVYALLENKSTCKRLPLLKKTQKQFDCLK